MKAQQITRIVTLVLLLVFLYLIRNILFPLIFAGIVYYLLIPLVNRLSDKWPKGWGLNRDLSILIAFIVFILVIIAAFQFIVPPFADEFGQLMANSPQYVKQVEQAVDSIRQWRSGAQLPKEVGDVVSASLQNFFGYMVQFVQQGANALINMLSGIIYLVIVPIVTYFLLRDDRNIVAGVIQLLPRDHQEVTKKILKQIDEILKNYVTGQLIICSLVGLVIAAGLYLLGIKFALILGLVAAVSQLIPNIGPFIGAIPSLIVALLAAPLLALKVLLFYLVINVLVMTIVGPKVLGNKLNLHPLTVVVSVLVFGDLMGVWGFFFAAPITAILKVLYLELRS